MQCQATNRETGLLMPRCTLQKASDAALLECALTWLTPTKQGEVGEGSSGSLSHFNRSDQCPSLPTQLYIGFSLMTRAGSFRVSHLRLSEKEVHGRRALWPVPRFLPRSWGQLWVSCPGVCLIALSVVYPLTPRRPVKSDHTHPLLIDH